MGPITWIIFGAIAGWAASHIAGTSRRQGCLANILVGIVGAFVGGLIIELVTGDEFSFAFNFTSFIVAILGAVVLLSLFSRRR
jgi:uncharacterized membrane protein YeaQ/YmgE (transglycosylase-associated protein family)